jgi:hypothetical protein
MVISHAGYKQQEGSIECSLGAFSIESYIRLYILFSDTANPSKSCRVGYSRLYRKTRLRRGVRRRRSAWASICRTRSRVTPIFCPTSFSV